MRGTNAGIDPGMTNWLHACVWEGKVQTLPEIHHNPKEDSLRKLLLLMALPMLGALLFSPAALAQDPCAGLAQGSAEQAQCYRDQSGGQNLQSDPGDNVQAGVVVGDDTPDCPRPEDVLESGLCAASGTTA